ncbi:MAG: Ig-like domain-containing protein [Clostridia bacterium]|nr:Ig-like domain-containing protein [Clostridia bacterium]
MKKTISLLLCIALCVVSMPICASAAETTADSAPSIPETGDVWDGSITQPTTLVKKDGVYYYEITKCSELAYVAQTGGDWLGYNYILGSNLILNDVELTWDKNGNLTNTETLRTWTPIGSKNGTSFSGIFDGSNYIVSGGVNGLFRGIGKNATVKNLTVVNSFVASNDCGDEVGGIAGFCSNNGIIENCIFSGVVKHMKATIYDDGIAGIVGHLNSGTVTNCTNYGNIYSAFYSGGIVGYCMGNVSNCKNYGNILTPSASAGGIIGYIGSVNSATYQNNINYGDVTTDYYAGGIIGSGGNWSGHPVRSCINFGRITSNTRGAGGICGWQYGMMSNCRNYGDIIGKQSAGGLSGRIYFGSVFYCGNYASVLSDDSAGGLVGSISSDSRPTIDSSFNTGNVSGTSYAGGIIGQPSSSSSAGEISNCYNTGNVTAEGYAGGIIADDIYYNIEYCYNIGAVHSPENAGMIAAASDYIWGKSSVSFCYYRETEGLFGLGRLEDEPKTAEAKTDQELMLESTFIAWNFSKTWSIATDKNGGYPYLQWQEGTLSDIAVNAVQISETALSLAEGDHEYLTARVSPANAKDQSVTWKSSDSTVATVSANGKVTAVAPGDATVTVTTTDGGFTATCAVTVTKRKPEEYKINSITVLDDDGKELPAVPTGDFLASVSITNLTSEGDTLVLLAAYTAEGKYKGLMWESVKDLPVGDTSEVTLPVENSAGTITQLKAFTIASFSNLVPIGSAVSFPMQ